MEYLLKEMLLSVTKRKCKISMKRSWKKEPHTNCGAAECRNYDEKKDLGLPSRFEQEEENSGLREVKCSHPV
jgi:hypothetical protein